MADPFVSNNIKKVDPTLKDLLDLAKKDIFLSFNCHAIATIQEFDETDQTVSATINYKKSFTQGQPDGSIITVLKDYPILVDVPVVILSGGPWSLTFPIAQGDECLILFNDRDIDNWFQSGQVGALASGRLHSFSDGIALVGLRSLARSIADYDTTRAVLGHSSGTMVAVGETLIKIANASTSLGAILTQLRTDLSSLATNLQGNPTGEPAAAAAGVALATAATSLQTLITELLE